MKRINAVVLTSLLAMGAYAAQAADAPAASTSVKKEHNQVKATNEDVNKQDKLIGQDKQDIAKDKQVRNADMAQLKKSERVERTRLEATGPLFSLIALMSVAMLALRNLSPGLVTRIDAA